MRAYAAATALLVAATACGTATAPATTAAAPPVVERPARHAVHVTQPATPKKIAPKPVARSMFRTPEAAMRYLARAYNAHDDVALRHVTTPHVRHHLEEMRAIARDLRLTSCSRDDSAYQCVFSHAYPHAKGRGKTYLDVAPAAKPGWYATVFEGCG